MSTVEFFWEKAPMIEGETMIEANAGTGKTFTLCRIVERLVLQKKIPIERILAVTFTNAAAYELKEKIREGLYQKRVSLTNENIEEKVLLSRALANFDNARIFTLHAFCKRLLSEFAFECGVRPESDLIINEEHLLEQVALDFRRSYFLDSTPFCSALSFTGNLKTKELVEAIKTNKAQEKIEEEQERNDNLNDQESFRAKEKETSIYYIELVNDWNSQLSDIKKFLFDGEARNGAAPKNNFYELEQRFANALQNIDESFPDYGLISLIRNSFEKEIKAKEGFCVPEFFAKAEKFCLDCEKLENFILRTFLNEGKTLLSNLKEKLNLRTFDDLQELVAEGLGGESGSSLVEKVFSQYDAALVDEFQDTDPLQFDILKKLFTQKSPNTKKFIFYIGDPKQSIYKFRGADLNNYLKVRGDMDKQNIYSLRTNYRTHPDLVSAVNLFITHKTTKEEEDTDNNLFMDKRIIFEESKGNEKQETTKLFSRLEKDLASQPFNIRYSPKLSKKETDGETTNGMLNDITREILFLLDKEKTTTIGGKPVRGSDIAVLCNTNPEANLVYQKLNEFEIPCVLQASRSIFDSEEAQHFKFLMEALLSPNDTSKVKKVLVLPIFSLSTGDIELFEESEDRWDFWANRFSLWGKLWRTHGFSYTIQTIFKDDFSFTGNKNELNSPYQPIKKRVLRNENGERRLTNYLHLGELLFQAEQKVSANFPRNLYLWYIQEIKTNNDNDESDTRLESDEEAVKILTIHKSKGLEFPITFIPFCWKVKRGSKKTESQQENMRLLYVALTRASSRIYFYIREPDNKFQSTNIARCISPEVNNVFESLKQKKDLFAVENCITHNPEHKFVRNLTTSTYSALEFTSRIPSGLIKSSFSQKVKGQNKEKDLDENEDTPQNLILPLPERKGAHAFPAGTHAGNFFHEVFENIDFSKNEHKEIIETQIKKHGIKNADPVVAHEIISATLNIQLNKHRGSPFTLSELDKKDIISEMEFHIHAPDFSFRELGKHLLKVDSLCTFGLYLEKKNDLDPIQLDQQFLKGFIDLTFKKGNQFFVLDWKSNMLTAQQNAFNSKILPNAMATADYNLQYHLYILALHRFLKNTLQANYSYSKNFGGVYYLFLRGIHRPIEPDDGIFFDCPKESLIEAMDHFLTFNSHL